MELYAIYLRKSRVDMEAESHGAGETLKRHEAALLALAKQRQLYVGEIYREVVSGDTIAGRPEMQRLLADVESGRWTGVLCMEESRLARGDTMDQGRVQQAFYYSHTLIITPSKTFDPDSEADQEYFEFGLFMSRREYKMINRRLQRGRLASVKEGNWVGAWAPYGYKKIRRDGARGCTLEIIPEQAQVVKSIFHWWALDGVSTVAIGERLNEAGVPTQKGQRWTPQSVRNVLDNPVYYGAIRYSYHRKEKRTVDGVVTVKYHRAAYEDGVTVFQGNHEPIIDKELFDKAMARRKWSPGEKTRPDYELQNPFAGIMHCGNCGRVLNRNKGKIGSAPRMICWYPDCKNTASTTIPMLEQVLLDTLRLKLAELELPQERHQADSQMRKLLEDQLAAAEKELEKVAGQRCTAYDLVEQGIYTPSVFAQRMSTLAHREAELTEQRATLSARLEELVRAAEGCERLRPKIRRVIDLYPSLTDARAKNELLRTCISGIIYHRPKGSSLDQLKLDVYYLV